jgi:tryptophan synthase alpha chain
MQTLTDNKLIRLFEQKNERLLNIYFTAGYPQLNSTGQIIEELAANGVDLIEIGMPYSDPLADGPVIQQSGTKALQNGMNLKLLFEQLQAVNVDCPLILMGYFNQILQFGVERFCQSCVEAGVSGLIVPDLPVDIYQAQYQKVFQEYGLSFTFLITPQTSEQRIRKIDTLSNGFIYMVSDASITGGTKGIQQSQLDYFNRIAAMKLENPRLIGFGISTAEAFEQACEYANGAIIGSAFIRALEQDKPIPAIVEEFVQNIRKN